MREKMTQRTIDINKSTILITGCAGFIGGSLALRLIETTEARIVGIDNMNDYYDVRLKEYRLNRIQEKDSNSRFTFIKTDISDKSEMLRCFDDYKPDVVIHLAAQAGVRYSIENPDVYIQSNIVGFYNMIEACRYSKEKLHLPVKHFLFASSSSVYGNNEKIPYSESDNTDRPVSLYAATKKADEALAYSYAKLYEIPMTGMRFFTVYGPAGRPDMAYYKFTEKLVNGKKIELYNKGNNKRDFTYIDDVVNAIEKIIPSVTDVDGNEVRYRIYNIGNNHPVDTISFVKILVNALKDNHLLQADTDAEKLIEYRDAVAGDVEVTYADVDHLGADFGITPVIDIAQGLGKFAAWYAERH